MTFTEAVRSCFRQYAGFEGRAPRSEFWWFTLFYLLVDIAVFAVAGMLIGATVVSVQGNVHQTVSWYVLTAPQGLVIVTHLALFLPTLAVTVRRLHDVGRSGWWFLVFLVPFFGILLLLFWWVQPSQREPNAYGPPLLPVR